MNESAEPVQVPHRKQFPVLGSQGVSVDWQFVADHGRQANANHYQTVERLAKRGGLSWCELCAVIQDRKWHRMETADAIEQVRAAEARYLSAIKPEAAETRAEVERLKALVRRVDGLIQGVQRGGHWIGPSWGDEANLWREAARQALGDHRSSTDG